MTMIGRGEISLRKMNVVEGSENALNVGERKIRFAHQANLNDTEIDLTNLNFPSSAITTLGGNPSGRTLQECNLRFFYPNMSLFSTARGLLIPDISYTCTNSKIIFKGFQAYANEIFYGIIDHATSPNTLFVNAKPLNVSRNIGAAQTTFNVGEAFKVNAYPAERSGSVKVFAGGVLLLRNTNNSSTTTDGAYYEVPSSDGYGTTIEFNTPFGSVTNITVISNYAYIDRPDFHVMQKMDVLAAQLESIAQQGSFNLDLTAFPNSMDLKTFGDRLLLSEAQLNEQGTVGDIVDSVLTEAQFQAERDVTWILADGRDITGSDLHALTGMTNAIDARGLFRRGINHGRTDGLQDPDGERAPGSTQGDAIRNITASARVAKWGTDRSGAFSWSASGSGPSGTDSGNTGLLTFNASSVVPTAPENRPCNIAVNVFIKINRI